MLPQQSKMCLGDLCAACIRIVKEHPGVEIGCKKDPMFIIV